MDLALEEVSSAQAKLGAIQNRLQHNIDNLSKGAMLIEQAVGRVVDANFASETSNLSKQKNTKSSSHNNATKVNNF